MCGIAGIFHFEPTSSRLKEKVRKMIQAIKHRGPDSEGYYEDQNISLGHCRLSIIDLTTAGHQPMCNENGSVWMTYNGEIYNYKELRHELESKNHRFKSNTDTEVIIHAYEEWGEACVKKFNGMWAIAIWDKKQNRLFCSRDRFGIKPFFYYYDSQKLIFASEIKSILKALDFTPSLNEETALHYLISRNIDSGTHTFYKQIQRIEPGCYFTIDQTKSQSLKHKRYWDIEVNKEHENNQIPYEETINQFAELFENSIRLRLRSDVPVGSCLSGGLDSSSIVCLMHKILKQQNIITEKSDYKINTFSACYNDDICDETEYIDEVTKTIESNSFKIYPESTNLIDDLTKVLQFQDEPFSSTSVLSQWNVMKLASQKNTKVLLDGQGADELLAGYLPYIFLFLHELFKNRNYFKGITNLVQYLDLIPSHQPLKWYLHKIFSKIFNRHSKFNTNSKYFTQTPSFPEKPTHKKLKGFKGTLKSDILDKNIPELLRYEDRNSMAFSIETRLPFLDYQLVEFVFKLPTNFLFRNGWTKWILRESMKTHLPTKISQRRNKLGFATPESKWLLSNKDNLKKIFNESYKKYDNYLINRKLILKNIDNLCTQIKDPHPKELSRFLMLDLWLLSIYKP